MAEIRKAQKIFLAMNTVVSHTAYGRMAGWALTAAQRETRRLERLFSRFLPDSDIARLNRTAGGDGIRMARDTFAALSIGRECAKQTDGCFAITAGPLVRLWNTPHAQPKPWQIDEAKLLSGNHALQLRPRGRMARLMQADQSVDLGGIGKGYAADRMLDTCKRFGIRSAFADFGGNVAVLGSKPDGSPWTIGIRHPLLKDELIGVLSVTDQSVVTSGDDQRAVPGADGVPHSHIMDPRTGLPAQSGLLSVTVISKSSTVADALATALFVTGMEQGIQYLQRFPGTQAVWIDRDGLVHLTDGLTGSFQAAPGIKTAVIREGTRQ